MTRKTCWLENWSQRNNRSLVGAPILVFSFLFFFQKKYVISCTNTIKLACLFRKEWTRFYAIEPLILATQIFYAVSNVLLMPLSQVIRRWNITLVVLACFVLFSVLHLQPYANYLAKPIWYPRVWVSTSSCFEINKHMRDIEPFERLKVVSTTKSLRCIRHLIRSILILQGG